MAATRRDRPIDVHVLIAADELRARACTERRPDFNYIALTLRI